MVITWRSRRWTICWPRTRIVWNGHFFIDDFGRKRSIWSLRSIIIKKGRPVWREVAVEV